MPRHFILGSNLGLDRTPASRQKRRRERLAILGGIGALILSIGAAQQFLAPQAAQDAAVYAHFTR